MVDGGWWMVDGDEEENKSFVTKMWSYVSGF